MRKLTTVFVMAALAGALAAGCAATGGPGTSPPPPGTTSPAGSATESTGDVTDEERAGDPPAGGPAAEIADGRHPGYIRSLDVGSANLTFDLVVFLTGKAADAEYLKRNPSADPDYLPINGYLIVNDNPKLRTLALAATVTVTLLAYDGGSPDPVVSTTGELGKRLKSDPDGMYWLTVKDGEVVRIEQQFFP